MVLEPLELFHNRLPGLGLIAKQPMSDPFVLQ